MKIISGNVGYSVRLIRSLFFSAWWIFHPKDDDDERPHLLPFRIKWRI